MAVTVLQAHPLDASYNKALLDAAVGGLEAAGVDHVVVRMCQGDEADLDRIAASDHLVVVAPTWWGAMPAVMLDWIQRTLGPWIDGDAPRATSPLRSVRRLSVVTSHGSARLVNRLQGEPGRQLWARTVLPLCAAGARFDWIALYKIDRLDVAAREAFIERVRIEVAAAAAGVTSG